MPYVGASVTVRPKEECHPQYERLKKTNLYFMSQNAFKAPKADAYVKALFEEAPQAKEAVEGKLAIVTGVTIGGAGVHMAEELALGAGMHVILMGRSEQKLKDAIEAIKVAATKRDVTEPTLYETKFDLDSLKSAKAAAEYAVQLAKEKYGGKIYVLVNNAGVLSQTYGLTADGVETNVGRNYVCTHYLTKLLLPNLKAAATSTYKPRVVHVSSLSHTFGPDLDPTILLNNPKVGGAPDDFFVKQEDGSLSFPSPALMTSNIQYGRAKFGLIVDAIYLSTAYPEINFTSQHPGSILSNFANELGVATKIYYYMFYPFQFSPSQGARAVLRAALDPDMNSAADLQGAFLGPDANPWTPAYPTLKDPATGEPYSLEDFSKLCYESVEKLLAQIGP